MTTPLPRRAWALDEVASQLGVSYTAVYRAVRSGQLPARKLGGRWLVSDTALAEWLTPNEEEN